MSCSPLNLSLVDTRLWTFVEISVSEEILGKAEELGGGALCLLNISQQVFCPFIHFYYTYIAFIFQVFSYFF